MFYIRIVIISFQLNINTLAIKILYNLRGFTVQVTYICQNYLGFHTVSFENYHGGLWNYRRGFLHIWPIFEQWFCLCSFANYPDKVAKDELLSVPAQPLSCIIVQYRALSCKIAHYLRKSAKIIGLFFGRYREMLQLCIRLQTGTQAWRSPNPFNPLTP